MSGRRMKSDKRETRKEVVKRIAIIWGKLEVPFANSINLTSRSFEFLAGSKETRTQRSKDMKTLRDKRQAFEGEYSSCCALFILRDRPSFWSDLHRYSKTMKPIKKCALKLLGRWEMSRLDDYCVACVPPAKVKCFQVWPRKNSVIDLSNRNMRLIVSWVHFLPKRSPRKCARLQSSIRFTLRLHPGIMTSPLGSSEFIRDVGIEVTRLTLIRTCSKEENQEIYTATNSIQWMHNRSNQEFLESTSIITFPFLILTPRRGINSVLNF